jgi:enoyl-CoA hydratase
MYQTLLTSLENNIFIITINRPDKLNALNKDVLAELNLALDEIEKNPEIRSAIISLNG